LKLLLIGFNTRSLAESSAAAGYPFISLDCFGDLDHGMLGPVFSPRHPVPGLPQASRINIGTLAEWGAVLAKQEHCDSLMYASGLENRPELLAKLLAESGCKLLGNAPSSLAQVRDPVALSNKLREAGFHAPETRRADAAPLDHKRQWLIKPMKSGGGHGVVPFAEGVPIPAGSVYQEFVSGNCCSFSFVSDGSNSLVLGITEQFALGKPFTGRRYGYAGNLFPLQCDNPRKLLADVTSIAQWLTVEYKLVGLNGVDFILHGDECWVIEVNPRYSASMELFERAYGSSMIKVHLLACSGRWREVESVVQEMCVEEVLSNSECFWGKKVIYTRKRKQVLLQNSKRESEAWARELLAHGLRDLPFLGDVIPARRPVATAIASGATREECLKKLEDASGLMQSNLVLL
jgi:predicted ATP-grasp superfamily ATP-dependent carboligase